MNALKDLESMGLTLPEPLYIFGAILFGILGIAAWRYGKKTAQPVAKWIGVTLMLYPYAVSNTWLLYAVGSGLCLALYVYRRR